MKLMGAFAAIALVAAVACTPTAEAPAASASETAAARHPVSGLPIVLITIESGGKAHHFRAEYASKWPDLTKGLMFRTELGPDEGMLFDYHGIYREPEQLSYWMKNTVIPLDIIFIGGDGRIVNIAAKAVPYSTESLHSDGPAIAVIEIPGGRAAELGIKAGDTVIYAPPKG